MIDLILVMSVHPGYGKQAFIPETVNKVKELREYLKEKKAKVIVNVDGGINDNTIKEVRPYVDMAVSGSFITNSKDYQEQIDKLR